MKKLIKTIIMASFIVFGIVELVLVLFISFNPDRVFLFKFDIYNGWDIFVTAFNIPLQLFIYYALLFGILKSIYQISKSKKRKQDNRKEDKYLTKFTKQETELIKQIHKRKITDFETLIIKYLKPQIRCLGIPYKLNSIEFHPDDKVYVFDDPREIYLKIKSMVEVLNFLITNNAIELISKYERINKSKTLNTFYVFTKPPTEKNYFWDKRLNDILYENFGIIDFDKEIKPVENRLQQFIN